MYSWNSSNTTYTFGNDNNWYDHMFRKIDHSINTSNLSIINFNSLDYNEAFNYVKNNDMIINIPDMRNNETLDNHTSSEFTIEDGKQYIKHVEEGPVY